MEEIEKAKEGITNRILKIALLIVVKHFCFGTYILLFVIFIFLFFGKKVMDKRCSVSH